MIPAKALQPLIYKGWSAFFKIIKIKQKTGYFRFCVALWLVIVGDAPLRIPQAAAN